jgi:integrase
MRGTPFQANRVVALLSKMLSLAERWGLRPDGSNPTRHVERFREKARQRYLSEAELARLGDALAESESMDLDSIEAVAAIRLLLFTGARMGEILTLRWDDVDLERRCLRLPDSKTGAKLIQLNAPALEVLASLKQRSEWVLPGKDPKKRYVNLAKPWARISQRAELDDVRVHDLRHSFAAVGAGAGGSLLVIGGLLGHKSAATTARYAHLSVDPLRAANEVIGSRIDAALRGTKPADVVPLVRADHE